MDVMHSTLRDMEHFHTKLIQENDKLTKESEYSKVIVYLVQENIQLRATNQSLRETSRYDGQSSLRDSNKYDNSGASFHPLDGGGDVPKPNSSSSYLSLSHLGHAASGGTASSSSPPPDKSVFYRHLQQNPPDGDDASEAAAPPPRTSSPDENFHTFLSSMHADDEEESTGSQAPGSQAPGSQAPGSSQAADDNKALRRLVKQPGRLLGEIAFQLDQRILSHIFQGQTRLYGFTVHNIAGKIADVAVHPVTGRLDDAYRRRLSRRHAELMERLGGRGYKAALHPTFTEFVVNAYGIVEQRPGGRRDGQEADDFNDVDFLARLVASTAPGKLHKDLLVLLRCLADMAAEDGRPLFLW